MISQRVSRQSLYSDVCYIACDRLRLGERFQYRLHFLCDARQHHRVLLLRAHHVHPLIAEVLQRRRDVHLLDSCNDSLLMINRRLLPPSPLNSALPHPPPPLSFLPLLIRLRTMSNRQYVPERPAPSLQWTTMGQERPRYDLFTFLQTIRRRMRSKPRQMLTSEKRQRARRRPMRRDDPEKCNQDRSRVAEKSTADKWKKHAGRAACDYYLHSNLSIAPPTFSAPSPHHFCDYAITSGFPNCIHKNDGDPTRVR